MHTTSPWPAAVIAFTELLSESSTNGQRYTLSLYDSGKYMRLDAAAQRALNVMPSRTDANSSFSLYGLMNRARSAMGKRRLKVCAGAAGCRRLVIAMHL